MSMDFMNGISELLDLLYGPYPGASADQGPQGVNLMGTGPLPPMDPGMAQTLNNPPPRMGPPPVDTSSYFAKRGMSRDDMLKM